MKNPAPRARASRAAVGRPKHQPHALPKWFQSSPQLQAVARSRCLMVLSVLSGEKSVSDAVARAKISHNMYYQMERRALNAILVALHPHSRWAQQGALQERIKQLEAQLKRLGQQKRRSQRLLLLMRKSSRAPLTRGLRGPWPRKASQSAAQHPTGPGASLP
jgi:hypothetical protein